MGQRPLPFTLMDVCCAPAAKVSSRKTVGWPLCLLSSPGLLGWWDTQAQPWSLSPSLHELHSGSVGLPGLALLTQSPLHFEFPSIMAPCFWHLPLPRCWFVFPQLIKQTLVHHGPPGTSCSASTWWGLMMLVTCTSTQSTLSSFRKENVPSLLIPYPKVLQPSEVILLDPMLRQLGWASLVGWCGKTASRYCSLNPCPGLVTTAPPGPRGHGSCLGRDPGPGGRPRIGPSWKRQSRTHHEGQSNSTQE